MFTEFINVDGLTHPEGRKNLAVDLKYSENQRPIVAQIWGRDPQKFLAAAKIVADLGFDGVDINMGCPQSKEISVGACAALIREPKLALEIIEATKKGAGSANRRIPVSVKTRIGYSRPEEMEGWVKNLLSADIAVLTLHARTKQEKSAVPAHWDKISEAVALRNQAKSSMLILGNGDIKSRQEGLERIVQTKADGVMVGRGAFGKPWFFSALEEEPDAKKRLELMLEHARLFDSELSGNKPFVIMRKHFKAYCAGFPGAHELRAKLMQTKNLDQARAVVEEFSAQ